MQHSWGRLRSQAKHNLACSASRTAVHQQLSGEPSELADHPLVWRQRSLAWLSQGLLVPGKALSSQATELPGLLQGLLRGVPRGLPRGLPQGLPQGLRPCGWMQVGWGD